METKICSKCKEEKNVCEFNKEKHNKSGLRSECKLCRKLTRKINYEINRPNILEDKKQYYLSKKNVILEKAKEYHHQNSNKIKEYRKKYYQNNKNKFNDYYKLKYQNNVLYRIGKIVRRRLHDYITKNDIKIEKTFDIIGCSQEFLKKHLEIQFIEGMSWENQGKWHIDHKIPLSSAKTEEEVYKLCHYTNLQPLWAEDNLKKGSKII
jgi:hypothetical protein